MFRLIEGGDFGLESANVGACYVSFLPKANGDPGIFRGPAIEEEGFLDIGVDCVKDAAQQIGWKSPESIAQLEFGYQELKKENKKLKSALTKAEKALGLVKELKKK
tara:strand:- start:818 stop:1135 length:318 start_codon:yes stop_codon:yes gene_type:complete